MTPSIPSRLTKVPTPGEVVTISTRLTFYMDWITIGVFQAVSIYSSHNTLYPTVPHILYYNCFYARHSG